MCVDDNTADISEWTVCSKWSGATITNISVERYMKREPYE